MNEPYPLSCPDVPASQIFRAKDVRKSGMLRKKAGGFKFTLIQNPYDHRFVIIHKGWVYYYKNEKSEKQQGKFSLEGYSSNVVNAEEEEAKIQHVFKVYGKSAGTRIWYFAAENEMEKREWMEAFRLEIEQYKFAASSIKCSSSSPYPRSGGTHTSINERPKSINIPDGSFKQLQRSPLTNFTSSATIDTGFSSMGSLDPEDDYEPVSINDADLDDDDDEFDTDSNEDDYENPFTQPMDVVNKNVPKPIFPHEDPPGIAPPVPKRDPVTELLKRSDSIALAAELELHRKSHGHISSSPQYFFGNTSTGPNSRRFPSDDRVPKVSHNHTRPPPPVPLKPSPSHYLSMSPTGSSPTFAKRPVPPSLRINPAHKNLKSPGLKFSPQPGHSCQSTIPSFSKHQSTDDTVRGSSTSKGAATATWLIGTKPMQRPISDAFALGGKFGQQKFTSEQTNRHSADITHISREWDMGRDAIQRRPPEPLPHSAGSIAHDVPRRPPPRPPQEEHQDMNSNTQHAVGQSPKRIIDFQQLPHHPGSPPFGFGVHKPNFNSHYAKDNAMPRFRLPPTTSNQGNMNPEVLEQSPEYCDMDIPDEQPSREVNQRRKPFTGYPAMPPMEEPSLDQHTGKSTLSQHHGKFQSPPSCCPGGLLASSTQMHESRVTRYSDSHAGPRGVQDGKPTVTKPPPTPLKPVLPRKPHQPLPGNKGKPLPPVKPSNLHGSRQPVGVVNTRRAAFESNQK